MAREFAGNFYRSPAWRKVRKAYIASVNGLCERCMKENKYVPGWIVHHKVHLNPSNINDPSVTLSWSNLEYLCQDCHNKEHHSKEELIEDGLMFDEYGDLVQSEME